MRNKKYYMRIHKDNVRIILRNSKAEPNDIMKWTIQAIKEEGGFKE